MIFKGICDKSNSVKTVSTSDIDFSTQEQSSFLIERLTCPDSQKYDCNGACSVLKQHGAKIGEPFTQS